MVCAGRSAYFGAEVRIAPDIVGFLATTCKQLFCVGGPTCVEECSAVLS